MNIKEKNKGSYIKYNLSNMILSFRDGELEIDLEKEQCGYDAHIVISEDENGKLVCGCARKYIAEILIPKKQYRLNLKGYIDGMGIEAAYRSVDPLDIENVELTLWAMEE